MPDREFKIPFDTALYPVRALKAGHLSCLYENGNLRRIKVDQTEILRMIYAAVRDENWNTASRRIENEHIEQKEGSFRITYTAFYQNLSVDYQADFRIEGKEDGTIIFSMKGKALSAFNRNRIGFCVLHPVSGYKGLDVIIRNDEGENDQRSFSDSISPHQLFKGIRQMDWTTRNNIKASLLFEGDVFETEDQRNWMDDSYKTYCTPLSLPIPVLVSLGETMEQRVILKVTDPDSSPIRLPVIPKIKQKMPFPGIGYAWNEACSQLTHEEIDLLKSLPFEQYRVEINFANPHWKEVLTDRITEAQQLNTKLELIAFFTPAFETETSVLLDQLKGNDKYISSILPLNPGYRVTPDFLLAYCYPLIKKNYPSIQVGYGADGYFTELNRQRPATESFDFVSFSCHPQVHAEDTRTILENLGSLPDIIETIRAFTSKPISVSPVTFKARKKANPNAQADPADERQKQWFGAGWTLLCLYFLGGAHSISLYQTNGENGILGNADRERLFRVLSELKILQPVWMDLEINGTDQKIIFENSRHERLVFSFASEYGIGDLL